jgi:3',5'-cyclic AMP phosphodiesterase CpdA
VTADGTILVQPYLQDVTPTSAWVLWETVDTDESRVVFGEQDSLGETACGPPAGIHEVQLTQLQPDTVYSYRVHTGDHQRGPFQFRTPPATGSDTSEADGPMRIVAMSDMQRDDAFPDKYREIVEDGLLEHVRTELGEPLADALDMVLVPGDLVDNGWLRAEWRDEFFAPGATLTSSVPVYPVLGNHEANSPFYRRYFHLPENGGEGADEHWYFVDHSNVRVIGLDSNPPFDTDAQLAWLDGVLAAACSLEHLDFVFVQLHHPHHSELWAAGESAWTGRVITRLEDFSTQCGKPSIHFFGHTHGYSRGQSRDHRHLMIDVASGGGAIDRWGNPDQTDFEEYSVTQDEWGFVLVDVQGGAAPSFRVQRFSLGNADQGRDRELTDTIVVHRYGQAPAQPTLTALRTDSCAESPALRTSDFSAPGGNLQQATRWQVAADCESFESPLLDRWQQDQNWYFGVDERAGLSLTEESIEALPRGASYCARARHRDDELRWSEWSQALSFALTACP